MSKFQEANPSFRKKLFTAYGIGVVALILTGKFIIPQLLHFASQLPPIESVRFYSIVSTTVLLIIFPVAGALRKLGKAIVTEKVYPIPSMKLIYRMKIKEGPEAIRIGKSLFRLGLLCQILIPLSILATWCINERFIADPASSMPIEIRDQFRHN